MTNQWESEQNKLITQNIFFYQMICTLHYTNNMQQAKQKLRHNIKK